ncbi:MAG: glyoxalase/bleomycin resistance/extradiol dioxygenase family protein [Saprospiraceae bacterium]|nr:glyoxalase/bleomycin resistance/extradiol dioxygenase family protein [Bacteroidia bacterium]NNE13341.1 glyoxalase/bleomycin resistance/extradiol dioxygenase family protein [Saprospiraceae bacterium]NNL91042.1 glyoxalase/bleomycin resistance/extradiol dioxygenase family protein [Saprospiraceae bacterium]
MHFKQVIPVLPSADIVRDTNWYVKYAGFEIIWNDEMYALLKRDDIVLHLQWHADTDDDPLLGGSVIRIKVEDINHYIDEFVERGTVVREKLRMNTPWNTHEFGFYDLNKNAVFIMQSLS